jgi:hypothetical protein
VLRLPRDSVEAIIWWEKRRIIYNLLLFVTGAVTILVIEVVGGRYANPGEDVESFRWATIFSVLLTLVPAVLVPPVWWVFGFRH